MTYTAKYKIIYPYLVHFLFPLFIPIGALLVLLIIGFNVKYFSFFLLYALAMIAIRWNTWTKKFIKNSLGFIRCETDDNGMQIFSKTGTALVAWDNIVKVNFQDQSFFSNRIENKNLGNFVVKDSLGGIFELPPTINDRDLLIKEIIEKAGLQEKHEAMFGESSSGYTYWEKTDASENVEPVKNINLFKTTFGGNKWIAKISIFIVILVIIYVIVSNYA